MVIKNKLNLKIILFIVFLIGISLVFSFLSNKSLKNPSITEELATRFRSIDESSLIQKSDFGMWWNDNAGYSLIASTSEAILVIKDFNSTEIPSNTIPDVFFKKELAEVKKVFAERGFIQNINNSSTSFSDTKFYDYIQAYQKNNYLCTATVSADVASYPGSAKNGRAEMGYQLIISCTDKLVEAQTEQIPFLDALDFKGKEEVAKLISSEGNYFHIEIHGRRAGSAAIVKKENGKYRVLLIAQEAPLCTLIKKENIPASVLTSIGGGSCYSDAGIYEIKSLSQ